MLCLAICVMSPCFSVPSVQDAMSKGDSSLEGMVKAGILGIQLLPRNALKGSILHWTPHLFIKQPCQLFHEVAIHLTSSSEFENRIEF